MKKINSLSDLLMEELANLLNAQNQLVEALPKMARASQSTSLISVLEKYLNITKEHRKGLEDVFSDIGQDPRELTCKRMKGIITVYEDAANKTEKSSSLESVIISVVQKAKAFEIAAYKRGREHATDLGKTRVVELLTKTLNEQRAMNFHLNEVAQSVINAQSGGFYVPEGRFKRGRVKKKSKNTEESRFISEGNPNTQEQ